MISGSNVRNDSQSLKSILTSYQGEIDGLNSNWKGPSYDNISTKAESFISEYQAIMTQMDSFASACDLYEQYKTAKQNYEISVSNYNRAAAQNDRSSLNSFQSDINKYSSEMDELKKQIEAALNSSKSPTLTATSNRSTADAATAATQTVTTGAASTVSASASAISQKAVDWAISIANDNSYGYVSGGMGNGGYDCTQLVHAAYEAAGISLPNKGNVNNANIVDYYTSMGFEWVPGPIDPSTLQAGDVLVNQAHHAEIYVGNGKKVGAHDNYDGGAGDSSGNEISVNDYCEFSNGGWDGYLRYVGTQNA